MVWIVVAVLVGLALHTPVTVFVESGWPSLELLVKSWKEITLALLGVLLVILLVRRGVWREVVRDRYMQIVASIAVLHVVLLVAFDNAYVSELAGLLIDLRYYLFFGELYIAARYIPEVRRYGVRAVAVGAAIVIGFGVLQATVLPKDILAGIGYSEDTIVPYLTVDLNHDYVRINSTLRGPNPVGAFAVIALCVVGAWVLWHRERMKDWRAAVVAAMSMLASVVVLGASYSRSAWLAAGAAAAVVLASILPKRVALYGLAAAGLVGVLALGALLQLRDVPAVSNLVFHSNPVGGSEHKSDDGHIESLAHGLGAAANAPLGEGVGSTGSASLLSDEPVIIENQYLFMAHESGWLGIGLQLVLFAMVLWGLWRARSDWLCLGVCAAGVGMALIGVLLPVWADDVVSLYWWGLAGLALGSSGMIRSHERARATAKTHKKTARTA